MGRLKSVSVFCVLAALLGVAPLKADEPHGRVNVDSNRIAIKGYDPVAYFTDHRPVKGRPELELAWHDARWLFASAAHRDRFAADPEKYSPRFGGFCALGIAMGGRFDIDPQQWSIVDGRLYLNYSREARDEWREDIAENIRKADKVWAAMK